MVAQIDEKRGPLPKTQISPLSESKIETRRVTGISKDDFSPFSENIWTRHIADNLPLITPLESLVIDEEESYETSNRNKYNLYAYIGKLKREKTIRLKPSDSVVFYQVSGKATQARKLVGLADFQDALQAPRSSPDVIMLFLFEDVETPRKGLDGGLEKVLSLLSHNDAGSTREAEIQKGSRGLELTKEGQTRLCLPCQKWANLYGTYLCHDLEEPGTWSWEPIMDASFHANVESVVRSARDGCSLCTFLLVMASSDLWKTAQTDSFEISLTVGGDLGEFNSVNLSLGDDRHNGWHGFELFTDQADATAESIRNHPISDDPISAFSIETSKNWIEECIKEHSGCSSAHGPVVNMPTRVIDIGPSTSTLKPKLIETSPDQHDDWIALSYCWGPNAQFHMTTKANKEMNYRGFDLSTLPRTYRDAIQVTRALGYRYIWIDALCIIQDDDADKMREIRNMHNTYRNAVLSLSVDTASSVEDGFLFNRSEVISRSTRIPYQNQVNNSYGCFYIRGEPLGDRSDASILDTRGWCLQENILSPRTLNFGRQQCFWNCQSKYYNEQSPLYAGQENGRYQSHLKELFLSQGKVKDGQEDMSRTQWMMSRWYTIVNDYGNRSLTNANDIIPGIAGIAEEITNQTGYDYRAGLWQQDPHRGLLWRTSECRQVSEKYRAPSWSWASVLPPAPGNKMKLEYYSWFGHLDFLRFGGRGGGNDDGKGDSDVEDGDGWGDNDAENDGKWGTDDGDNEEEDDGKKDGGNDSENDSGWGDDGDGNNEAWGDSGGDEVWGKNDGDEVWGKNDDDQVWGKNESENDKAWSENDGGNEDGKERGNGWGDDAKLTAQVSTIYVKTTNEDTSPAAQTLPGSFIRIRSAWSSIQDWNKLSRSQFYFNASEKEQQVFSHFPSGYNPARGEIVCDLDSNVYRSAFSNASFSLSFLVIIEEPLNKMDENGDQLLWCLILRRQEGEEEEAYTRIGVARIPQGPDFEEPDWMDKEVTIY